MPRQIIKSGIVSENRRARHDYSVDDTIEAGLSLTGAEVKSIRYGLVNITDAFVQTSGNTARRFLTRGADTNLVLSGMVITPLPTANRAIHFDERRPRQLLLHRNQINRLVGKLNEKGATIFPLKLYFNPRGRIKVLLGIGFGKTKYDKRETIKAREWQREKARVTGSR